MTMMESLKTFHTQRYFTNKATFILLLEKIHLILFIISNIINFRFHKPIILGKKIYIYLILKIFFFIESFKVNVKVKINLIYLYIYLK